jgi:hypothetical protein
MARLRKFGLNLNRSDWTLRRNILRCDPDEIAFHYRFKDVVVEGQHLVITSRASEPLVRIPLRTIHLELEKETP